jgi:multidrug efflux pump subunit AcrA (membrane-fusion protein)
MQIPHRSLCRLIAAVGGAALLGSCGSGQPPAAGPGPGAAALPVGIVTAVAQSVPMVTQLPGRTTPYLIAEVRPQVSGIVSRRAFVEAATSRRARRSTRLRRRVTPRRTTARLPDSPGPRRIVKQRG